VLRSARAGRLAVDPKGAARRAGVRGRSAAANPWPDLLFWPEPGQALARRVDKLAEGLRVDRERVRALGYAVAMLSAVWFDEGGEPVDPHPLRCAELLAGQ